MTRPTSKRAAENTLAELVLAYSGQHGFDKTKWLTLSVPWAWTLDVITSGMQMQRIEDGATFRRGSGLFALYAPGTRYSERQVEGQMIREAYMVFTAPPDVEKQLSGVVGKSGYCHIEDPHQLATAPLERLGARFAVNKDSNDLLTQGLMLECLGHIVAATIIEPRLRRIAPEADPKHALQTQVSEFLEANIGKHVTVGDLAAGLSMSVSTLAHKYAKIAGETPYEAILRSKIAAAKRLLLSQGLNVKETAYRVGFNSAFNFSRTFKRLEGSAPSRYIKDTEKTRTDRA